MKVMLYKGDIFQNNPNATACVAILEHCRIRVETVQDTGALLRISKGSNHPLTGIAIVSEEPGSPVIKNFVALVKWIEERGLMPANI